MYEMCENCSSVYVRDQRKLSKFKTQYTFRMKEQQAEQLMKCNNGEERSRRPLNVV